MNNKVRISYASKYDNNVQREKHSIVLSPSLGNPNFIYYNSCFSNSRYFHTVEKKKLVSNKQIRKHGVRSHIYKIKVDQTYCLIDGHDVSPISMSFIENNKELFKEVKFYFLMQYTLRHKELFDRIKERYGFTILPLTYGVSRNFPIKAFKWTKKEHKYIANSAFTISIGRQHRIPWVHAAKKSPFFFSSFCKNKNKYINILKDCKWGLSIRGSHLEYDGKCFREAEFISLGMPLALNYVPCYPFPFYPNEHYVYLSEPSDIFKLKDIDPAPYARRTLELWKRYFSPDGVVNLLLELIYNKYYLENLHSFWGHFFDLERSKSKKTEILRYPRKCNISIGS